MRINKALAAAGVCSRRAADELIASGTVLVNGQPAKPGMQVSANDEVTVDGRAVALPLGQRTTFTYLLCNKPRKYVSTASDPQGRRTILDLVPAAHADTRLYPVGRLDYDSEGLILLTNNGELTHRLTHPSHHLPKTYRVSVAGPVSEKQLQTFRAGMTLAEGDKVAPVGVEIIKGARNGGDSTLLEMVLIQGLNRQIRRMCRDVGLEVKRLVRIGQGPLKLGSLRPGECRLLRENETTALLRDSGLAKPGKD
ncbi:pseudouridine synthase [Oceanidesulfovibrio marinus]|nr:pseudouridine synthase [Oceanidesulfovibrio marinus]